MDETQAQHNLAEQLTYIEALDPDLTPTLGTSPQAYDHRNRWVYRAIATAGLSGLRAGLSADPKPEDPAYPILAWIELPTGQVSWHLPTLDITWDGHSAAEKYDRIRAFVKTMGVEQ